MMKHKVLLPLTAIAVAIGLGFSGVALAGWEPKKPVDFVIMAGKGGGADKMARLSMVYRLNRLCRSINRVVRERKHCCTLKVRMVITIPLW